MNDLPADPSQPRLITALRRPECYRHPIEAVRILETHISWVILTGRYAYKIKKPVNLGFLDFTTLEARHFYCCEELRLNRRLAPALYLDVVAITGTPEQPCLDMEGQVIEYAVKMAQFEQDQLASRLIKQGRISALHIEQLAQTIARFHEDAAAAAGSRFGSPDAVLKPATQNFEQLLPLVEAAGDRAILQELWNWTESEHGARAAVMAARQRGGWVRECHGDLHLGNIVLIGDELTPFDCIEFNEAFRWIDVMSEVAFLVMDLIDRGRPDFASLFLSAYLEHAGDYDGLKLLRFYLVYRALVRAKVHCMRARQPGLSATESARLLAASREYAALAARFTRPAPPAVIITHGLSGCGKTTLSWLLLQALGAVRIRSDVERKRLHGLAPLARSVSDIDSGLYREDVTRATYARLVELARTIVSAGYPVVVDAAFLKRWQRDLLSALARELEIPFVIAVLSAPEPVLQARIVRRSAAGKDASEAGLAVLSHQMATYHPIADDERSHAITLDGALSPEELSATPAWKALLGGIKGPKL